MVLPIDPEDVGEEILRLIKVIGLDKLSSRLIREKLSEAFKVQFGKEHKNEIDELTKKKIDENHRLKEKSADKEKPDEKRESSPIPPSSPLNSIQSEEPLQSYITEMATPKSGLRFLYCIVFVPTPLEKFFVIPHDRLSGRMIAGKSIKLKMPDWDTEYLCTIKKLAANENDANVKMRDMIAKQKGESVPKTGQIESTSEYDENPSPKEDKSENSEKMAENRLLDPEFPPEPTSPITVTPQPQDQSSPSSVLIIADSPKSPEPEKSHTEQIINISLSNENNNVPKNQGDREKSVDSKIPAVNSSSVQPKSMVFSDISDTESRTTNPGEKATPKIALKIFDDSENLQISKNSHSNNNVKKQSTIASFMTPKIVRTGPAKKTITECIPPPRKPSKLTRPPTSKPKPKKPDYVSSSDDSSDEEPTTSKKSREKSVDSKMSQGSNKNKATTSKKSPREKSVDSKVSQGSSKNSKKKTEIDVDWDKVLMEMPEAYIEIESFTVPEKQQRTPSSDNSSESEPKAIKSKSIKKKRLKDVLTKKPKLSASLVQSPKKNTAKKSIALPYGFKSIREERDEKLKAISERSETPKILHEINKENTPSEKEGTPKSMDTQMINLVRSSSFTSDTSKIDMEVPSTSMAEIPKPAEISNASTPTGGVPKRNPAKKSITNVSARKPTGLKLSDLLRISPEPGEKTKENASPKEPPPATVINFLKITDTEDSREVTDLWDEFTPVMDIPDETRRKERETPVYKGGPSTSSYAANVVSKPREKTEKELWLEKKSYEKLSGVLSSDKEKSRNKEKDKERHKKSQEKEAIKRKPNRPVNISSDCEDDRSVKSQKRLKITEIEKPMVKEKEEKKKQNVNTGSNISTPSSWPFESINHRPVAGSSIATPETNGYANGHESPPLTSSKNTEVKNFMEEFVQRIEESNQRVMQKIEESNQRHEESMERLRKLLQETMDKFVDQQKTG